MPEANRQAAALIAWLEQRLAELPSADDERWPEVERAMEEDRLSSRRRF